MESKDVNAEAINRNNYHIRYNWTALKMEFMRGPWETLADFFRFKRMKTTVHIFRKTKGWSKEKRAIVIQAGEKATGDLVEEKADDIREIQKRHARLARWMQLKGGESLKTLNPSSVDEARKLLLSGISEERIALGMVSGRGGATNLTQVNVNLPKTNLDKILDGTDAAGLLKLITDIKRQRAQRIGASTIVEGETED